MPIAILDDEGAWRDERRSVRLARKCVVTGGAGFIGSSLVHRLVSDGNRVTVIDNLSSGTLENLESLESRIEFVHGDIRDHRLLTQAFLDADVVFHEAAFVSVPKSVEDPLETNDVNVSGTLCVLSAAKERGVRRVVLASSSAVYGDSPESPKKEDMTPTPLSPYAATECIAEVYAKMYNDVYGLETVCLRYFNVYGPRQSPNSEYAAVIPKFICSMLDGVSPVIFGDGNQTRDFVYIDDVVEANLAAADVPGVAGQNINVGCGQEHSVNELVALLNEVFRTNMRPEYRPPRKGDLVHSVASIEKLEQMLHCAPRVSLKEGLARTVEWFRKRQAK